MLIAKPTVVGLLPVPTRDLGQTFRGRSIIVAGRFLAIVRKKTTHTRSIPLPSMKVTNSAVSLIRLSQAAAGGVPHIAVSIAACLNCQHADDTNFKSMALT